MLLMTIVVAAIVIAVTAFFSSYFFWSSCSCFFVKTIEFFIKTSLVVISSVIIAIVQWTFLTISILWTISIGTIRAILTILAFLTVSVLRTIPIGTVRTILTVSILWTVILLFCILLSWTAFCKIIHITCCTLADWTHCALSNRTWADNAVLFRTLLPIVSSRTAVIITVVSVIVPVPLPRSS